MNTPIPYYKQLGDKLFLFILIVVFIFLTQKLLIPIVFSILFAIILLPFNNLLERLKCPRALANAIAITVGLILIGSIIYFFSIQISGFIKDLPAIKKNMHEHYITAQNWIEKKLDVSTKSQSVIINNATAEVKNSGGSYIGETFLTISEALLLIVLVAFYTFFILYYRHLIKRFFFSVFSKAQTSQVNDVLTKSKKIIQKYVTGLLIEMVIVATANSIILLMIGIKYAIFLGILAGILNIIPYVGIYSSILFTALVTLSTSSNMGNIAWIIIGMGCVHLADANFILPKIVGSKVRVNALVSFIGIVSGAEYIGVSGIFLALPVIAVVKIIFDTVDSLKPWGILMGEEEREEKPVNRIHK
jgi:predicted PurR-regulated permease PerM